MKNKCHPSSQQAFTRLELMVVLVMLALLAVMALPVLANTRYRSEQISCFNNLRQIGHAFHLWANDHGDKNPWWTSIRDGGTYNTPGDPVVPWLGLRNNAFFPMAWISNELATPKILVCPSDQLGAGRRMASNFSGDADGGFLNAAYKNNALSYSIGLHSYFGSPRTILSGDRNIRFDSFNSGCASQIGLLQAVNDPGSVVRWTNAIHGVTGNILFTGGEVEQTSTSGLRDAMNNESQSDNGSVHFINPP